MVPRNEETEVLAKPESARVTHRGKSVRVVRKEGLQGDITYLARRKDGRYSAEGGVSMVADSMPTKTPELDDFIDSHFPAVDPA